MADGVRIEPDPARLRAEGITDTAGRLFIIRDISRPFIPNPDHPCGVCGTPHDCKTYHLQLDTDGTVLVSTTIWERLQRLYDHGGFRLVNHTPDPPAQQLIIPPAAVTVTAPDF